MAGHPAIKPRLYSLTRTIQKSVKMHVGFTPAAKPPRGIPTKQSFVGRGRATERMMFLPKRQNGILRSLRGRRAGVYSRRRLLGESFFRTEQAPSLHSAAKTGPPQSGALWDCRAGVYSRRLSQKVGRAAAAQRGRLSTEPTMQT